MGRDEAFDWVAYATGLTMVAGAYPAAKAIAPKGGALRLPAVVVLTAAGVTLGVSVVVARIFSGVVNHR